MELATKKERRLCAMSYLPILFGSLAHINCNSSERKVYKFDVTVRIPSHVGSQPWSWRQKKNDDSELCHIYRSYVGNPSDVGQISDRFAYLAGHPLALENKWSFGLDL